MPRGVATRVSSPKSCFWMRCHVGSPRTLWSDSAKELRGTSDRETMPLGSLGLGLLPERIKIPAFPLFLPCQWPQRDTRPWPAASAESVLPCSVA